MINCIVVGLGGFFGAVLRYLISLIPLGENVNFPYKTLIINVLGAFVIGIIVGLALKNSSLDPRLVLFIKVGVCGGFTTFSTFALESYNLFYTSHIAIALLYIALSVILSIVAVFGALALIK